MEVDWGFIAALSIGIGLLVIAVIWIVRAFPQWLTMLKLIVKAIANHLKR
jgi:hypothetical protein